MCFAVGSGSLRHGLTSRLNTLEVPCPPSGIFQEEFCKRWCSSVILRNGSGKQVTQMISHKRDETKVWLQISPEQGIHGGYKKNG